MSELVERLKAAWASTPMNAGLFLEAANEIESLRTAFKAYRETAQEIGAARERRLAELVEENAAARKQLEKARKALGPFASIDYGIEGADTDRWFIFDSDELLVGDFRAARAALTDEDRKS